MSRLLLRVGAGIFCIGAISQYFASSPQHQKGDKNIQIKGNHNRLFFSPQSRQSPVNKANPISSDLRLPDESVLLERPALIKDIDSLFQENSNGLRKVALAGVVGLGGVGKTTLARMWAKGHKLGRKDSYTVWEINAEKQSIFLSFCELANALASTLEDQQALKFIRQQTNPIEREPQIIEFVRNHLKDRPQWLLIFDNVDSLKEIEKYLPSDPALWGDGNIIITTRNKHIYASNYINKKNILTLNELDPEEAFRLFTRVRFNCEPEALSIEEQEKVKAFLKKIPLFPHDINIAARYIAANYISYGSYLNELKSYNKEFCQHQAAILEDTGNVYSKTRYSIISLSLESVIKKHSSFKDLLMFISLLNSQHIPRGLLEDIAAKSVVGLFFHELNKYSLITEETFMESFSTFSLHRSTHDICRVYLNRHLGNASELDIYVNSLSKHFEISEIPSEIGLNFDNLKLFLTHAESLLSKTESYSNANIEKGILLRAIGICYKDLGSFSAAERYLQKSCDLLKSTVKSKVEQAKSLANLAITLGYKGKFKQAAELGIQAINAYSEYYGKVSLELAWLKTHIANNYRSAGVYRKARLYYEEAYSIFLSKFPEHLCTFWCRSNLGELYRQLGFTMKAKELLEPGLSDFNYDCNRKMWLQQLLGMTYLDLGKARDAKVLLEESVKYYEKQFGKKNIKTIQNKLFLYESYIDLNMFKEAYKGLDECLNVFKEYYHEDHVFLAKVSLLRAKYYVKNNELTAADKEYLAAIKVYEACKHPELFLALEGLAHLRLKQYGYFEHINKREEANIKKKEARKYLLQAYKIVKNNFTEDSPHIQRLQKKLQDT